MMTKQGLFAAAGCFLFAQMLHAQPTGAPRHPGFSVPTSEALQMVVVVTPSWTDMRGTIRTFERDDRSSAWRTVHGARAMTLGSRGLGWGTGLHGAQPLPGPIKKEGDDTSPAGVFHLSLLYGYAPERAGSRFSMPYLALDSTDECIDDPSSMYYNMIVDRSNVMKVDWKSSERMRFQGKYYEWGVVVDNNMDPRLAAGGSCIFLHVWGGPDAPTSGCTSLDRDGLLSIMTWLNPTKQPVLVQLPKDVYDQLAGSWELP